MLFEKMRLQQGENRLRVERDQSELILKLLRKKKNAADL